jgi:cytoskeleton protein RodZ
MGWLPALPKSITQKFEKTPASAPASTPASAPTSVVATKPDNSSASATALVDGKEKTKQIELPAVDVSSQLASPSAATAAAAPDGTNAVPVQAEGASETPVAAAASSGNALVLKAREESWIELRRANGSVLYKGTIPAGGSETIEIAEPVQLTLGNGPGVDATMRGAPLEIPVDKYSKVVRLSLK